MEGPTYQFLKSLLIQSPLLVAYLIGAVLILVRWGRHPGASLLAFLGVGLYAFLVVLRSADIFLFEAMEGENSLFIYRIVAFAFNVLEAGAFVLLLMAVFSGRSASQRPQQRPTTRRRDED